MFLYICLATIFEDHLLKLYYNMKELLVISITIFLTSCTSKTANNKVFNQDTSHYVDKAYADHTFDSTEINGIASHVDSHKTKDSVIIEMIQLADTDERHYYHSFTDSQNREVKFFSGYTKYDWS